MKKIYLTQSTMSVGGLNTLVDTLLDVQTI